MAIKECSGRRYAEMLSVLPPALWLGKGFIVGEPYNHNEDIWRNGASVISDHLLDALEQFIGHATDHLDHHEED